MKRLAFLAMCALALLFGGSAVSVGAADASHGAANQPATGQTNDGASTPQSTSTVIIKNGTFTPPSITVPVGTTVTWINQDTTTNTVTNSVGGASSGTLQPGQSFCFTFNGTGTSTYHSATHPNAKSTVLVTPTAAPQQPIASNTDPQPAAPDPSSSSSSSSSSASGSSSSSSSASSGAASANPSPPPSQPPQNNNPSAMPNTGTAGAATAFTSTAVLGSGAAYLYARRKLKRL